MYNNYSKITAHKLCTPPLSPPQSSKTPSPPSPQLPPLLSPFTPIIHFPFKLLVTQCIQLKIVAFRNLEMLDTVPFFVHYLLRPPKAIVCTLYINPIRDSRINWKAIPISQRNIKRYFSLIT